MGVKGGRVQARKGLLLWFHGVTWAEFFPRYLDKFSKVYHRPATTALHTSIGKHLVAFLGDTPLKKTNDAKLDDLAAWLTKQNLSPRSVNICLHLVHQMIVVAIRWGEIKKKPFTKLNLKREPPVRIRVLDHESRSRLLWAARAHSSEIYEIILTFLTTGLRRAELEFLEWKDVNLEARSITVRNSKTGSARTIPVPEVTVSVLKHRLKTRHIRWVFYNPTTGLPWADLTHVVKKVLKKAGLEEWTLHDLRHAYASHLHGRGASQHDLQALLGHESDRMTARYVHVTHEQAAAYLDRLDEDYAAEKQGRIFFENKA